jgi:hypothetical protein
MSDLPGAETRISDTAGAVASGLDVICILSPCATSDDVVPRRFGKAQAAFEQHGYCEGVEYAAYHVAKTGKPFIFVGLPIVTAGVVGRVDKTGNTGTSVASVTAGADGVLGEHEGVVTVIRGGTVGTDQIVLGISLDNGTRVVPVKIGTGTSYVIPYVAVTLSLTVGTLIAGDEIVSWFGTAPKSDSSGWAAARTALASQLKFFRSALLTGDLSTDTEAQALLDEFNAYETENDRFTRVTASVVDRLPQAELSHDTVRMTGSATLTFAEVGASGDTITRSTGSWITDGFQVGDTITVAGSVSNNITGPIASLTATVITLGTTDLAAEGPVSNCTVVGHPTLTFAEVGGTGDTITRSRGSWTDDGFRVGDEITVAGTVSNNLVATAGIATLTALVMTLGTTDLAAEVIGITSGVTITAGQSKAVWMAALESEFESVLGPECFRITLASGRGRVASPFSQWNFRRSPNWAHEARQYQHDLHIASWRKADGSVGFKLDDADGNLVEWDDRVDGEAASAAGFLSFRTWSNGPDGAYIAVDKTRADASSLLSQSHNVDVVNLCQTTVQLNAELAVGQSLVLNDDGTATKASLAKIQKRINDALELALLKNTLGEGQRASKAVWTPSTDDVLNVPDATITAVTDLNLNGTIFRVVSNVRLRSGGQ